MHNKQTRAGATCSQREQTRPAREWCVRLRASCFVVLARGLLGRARPRKGAVMDALEVDPSVELHEIILPIVASPEPKRTGSCALSAKSESPSSRNMLPRVIVFLCPACGNRWSSEEREWQTLKPSVCMAKPQSQESRSALKLMMTSTERSGLRSSASDSWAMKRPTSAKRPILVRRVEQLLPLITGEGGAGASAVEPPHF
jgi:hypothetical protein